MTVEEVKVLALAIARANGHPEPEEWASVVSENFQLEEPKAD